MARGETRTPRGVRRAGRGRTARWAIAATWAVAVTGAAAPAASAGEQVLDTRGQVAAPLRFAADPTYSSWAGGQRQVYTLTGQNGKVGYTVELPDDGSADGASYDLAVTAGATGLEDLDITFYSSFNPVVSGGSAATRKAGGETGEIPDGSRFAIVTMFTGANAEFRLTATAPDAPRGGGGPKPPALPVPGIHDDFGKDGADNVAAKLRRGSQVVIAVVDTGVNPYHEAYRRPLNAVHPSRYIEGFPADAPALGLTQDGDYATARKSDDTSVWSQVEEKKLYWIPGTNIIGAYSVKDYKGTPPAGLPSRPVIDDHGHGTGTSSVAAGAGRSSLDAPFGSNPDALIVVIEGLGDEGVKWASEQPWIDFVSGSYGDPLALPCGGAVDDQDIWCGNEAEYTAPFVLRDGRTACFSAGNGLSRTGVATDRYSSLRPTSGPSWVVTVGAVSPRNGQDYGWHSVPVDVSSYGMYWPAADEFSRDGEQSFSGTSNATPVTCGVFSKALLEARRALGDSAEGIHTTADGERVPALGRRLKSGPLSDGVLARTELQDAVLKTALPEEFNAERWTYDPIVVPHTPLYYTQEGYGIANVASAERAVQVLRGAEAMPDRADVDKWVGTVDAGRDALYPPPQY